MRPRRFDHTGRQSEALTDGKRVRTPRHADQKPVGRPQRCNIEFAACVFNAGRIERIHFDLGVMRRGHNLRALGAQTLDNGDGKRRALHRIGARAKLVEQHERTAVSLIQNSDDIRHMRRKGG